MFIIAIIALLHPFLVLGDNDLVPDFGTYPHGNPFVPGTYGYPDAAFYNGTYWVYHADYPHHKGNSYIDAYSSKDLKTWRHRRVLSLDAFRWAVNRPLISVSAANRGNRYYLYFGTVDVLRNFTLIGVGVSSRPQGPYSDVLGTPLLQIEGTALNPGGTSFITDDSGQSYLYFVKDYTVQVAKLKEDMIHIDEGLPVGPKSTPVTDVPIWGGVKVFKRKEIYYMIYRRSPETPMTVGFLQDMNSDDSGTSAFPEIRYAISNRADSGFLEMSGNVAAADKELATTFGQATVINIDGTDIWYLVYARKLVGNLEAEASMSGLAYDRMTFDSNTQMINRVIQIMQDNFDNELHDRAIWTEYWANYSTVPACPDDNTTSAVDFSRLAYGDGDGRSMIPVSLSDFSYEISVAIPNDGTKPPPGSFANAGVVFRVTNPLISRYSSPQDDFEGYYAGIQVEPKKVILGLARNGTWKELTSADLGEDFNVSEWNPLRVDAVGSSFSVSVGGDAHAPKITVEDGTYSSGQIGLRAYNTPAKFDNLTIFPGGRGLDHR